MGDIFSFGIWIGRQRMLGLTQGELAQSAAVSIITIQKIEPDERRLSLEIGALLTKYLAVPEPTRAAFFQVVRGVLLIGRLPSPEVSAPTEVVRHGNLQAPLTVLIGRKSIPAELAILLRHPNVRFVIPTGLGGVGKFRVALQVTTDLLNNYPDGVWFVDLALLRDPILILPTMQRCSV